MARRLELISAGVASATTLLWLVYVLHIVQVLHTAVGATGQPFFQLDMASLTIVLAATAGLTFGLSIGAFMHVVRHSRVGAALMWVSALLLITDLAAYEFSGWGLLPTSGSTAFPLSAVVWTGTTLPTILPVLEVLATTFAVMAALASITLPSAAAKPTGERVPGGFLSAKPDSP